MIEEEIFLAISQEYKIHYAIAPAHTAAPYLVYTTVSEVKSDVFCGQAETNSVIQLDSYAGKPLEAKAHALKAFRLINSLNPCNVSSGGSFEEETGLYRYQIEFSIIN